MTSDRPPMTTPYRHGYDEPAHIYKRTDAHPDGERFACARHDEDGPLIAAALNAYSGPGDRPRLGGWSGPEGCEGDSWTSGPCRCECHGTGQL